MASLRIWFVLVLLPLASLAQKAPSAKPFETLDGTRYLPQQYNDGDSFHVRLKDGQEKIFRLYFVDTAESEATYAERTAEQAAYFGVSAEAATALGKEAAAFTKNVLSKPFTVRTRWHTALGRSKLPRYYAMVTTADGKDLAELLVSNGLARIYGSRTPLPDGSDSRTYLAKLSAVEAQAKAAHRGGWAKAGASKSSTSPASKTSPPNSSGTDFDRIFKKAQ